MAGHDGSDVIWIESTRGPDDEPERATGTDDAGQDKLFGYLRQLRTAADAGAG